MPDDPLGTIGDFPAAGGMVPVSDARFATHDIRLSSALCCLGFGLKLDAQPVAVTIDADKEQRIVTFFHFDASDHPKVVRTTARDVELWWNAPVGKFSIEGWDDALTAIRRVHDEREKMITVAKFPGPFAKQSSNGHLASRSLHMAAILGACEIKLVGYEDSTRRWLFGKGAEVIADLIKKEGKPKQRPLSNDLCIDWMLEALRYRDWLARLIKDPDCIPLIEMRDGKKILQISAGMSEKEQAKWISYL